MPVIIDPIDLGTLPNDGTGDSLRVAGAKINANFTELAGAADYINANQGLIYANADVETFRVIGYTTQTNDVFLVKKFDNTDLFTVDNSGNVSVAGTVDGRDLATDGTKLDGIEALADVTNVTNVNAALKSINTYELANDLTGDRSVVLDFHADDVNTDHSFRIIRSAGENGTAQITNQGTGEILIYPVGGGQTRIGGHAFVQGLADQTQLLVRGHSTQTNDIFLIEDSVGTDLLSVNNNGDVTIAGDVTVSGSIDNVDLGLYIHFNDYDDGPGANTGLRTFVRDGVWSIDADTSATAKPKIDIAGSIMVDGSEDVNQLTVQAHSTQTNDIFVVEGSAGSNIFSVPSDGEVVFSGTNSNHFLLKQSDQNAPTVIHRTSSSLYFILLSDSGAAPSGAFNSLRPFQISLTTGQLQSENGQKFQGGTFIDGSTDDIQLRVQGNAVQTNDIFVVEGSAGTDFLNVDSSGNLDVFGSIQHAVGWRDMISSFTKAAAGGIAPTLADPGNGARLYRFSSGDSVHTEFHVDHDIVPASTCYPHVHFFCTNALTAGQTVTWDFIYIIAKGHSQGESLTAARTTISMTYTADGTEIAGEHIVLEDATGFTLAEPDMIILAEYKHTGGTYTGDIYGVQGDIHYQSDREATPNRSPNFYA